jgi:hypothetical protein
MPLLSSIVGSGSWCFSVDSLVTLLVNSALSTDTKQPVNSRTSEATQPLDSSVSFTQKLRWWAAIVTQRLEESRVWMWIWTSVLSLSRLVSRNGNAAEMLTENPNLEQIRELDMQEIPKLSLLVV